MSLVKICDAMDAGKCLEIYYGGHNRLVEAHAVGRTKDDHEVVRIWQVSGGSSSGSPKPWRLLRVDEITSIEISSQNSEAPRPEYRRGDLSMAVIIQEV